LLLGGGRRWTGLRERRAAGKEEGKEREEGEGHSHGCWLIVQVNYRLD
jgi:hypothetical protein